MDAFNDPKVKRIVGVFSAQMAKALALNTKIPTPSGWTTMEDIQVGDVVFGVDGKPCAVIATTEAMVGKKCFSVVFEDGQEIIASEDHLWEVSVRGHARSGVLTTGQMERDGVCRHAAFRYRIPCCGALETPEVNLPLSPYLLGCWLGDGHTAGSRITVDLRDGVLEQISRECDGDVDVTPDARFPHVAAVVVGGGRQTWIGGKCRRGHKQTPENEGPGYCRKCKVLHAQKSQGRITDVPQLAKTFGEKLIGLGLIRNKRIPTAYLRASIPQRWALLQGLMDTDGSADKNGHCSFTGVSKPLCEDVAELVRSLGMKPSLRSKRIRYKGEEREYWGVGFRAYQEQPVFRLARKMARLRSVNSPQARPSEARARSIVAITPVDSVPVKCIAVDSPSRLYLAGDSMIATHNTTIEENVIGYHAHHDPAPIMWAMPTLEIAEAMSKDRLAPMIRDTPALKERFAEAGSKTSGDTLLHKKFPGGAVTIAGANSYNSLASRPIRIVIGDEAAKWKANEKGSPFRQISARVKTFWNSKVAFFSTPTDASPENEFHQLWEESDKRLYFVTCPECAASAVFTFDDSPESLPTAAEQPRIVLVWREGASAKTEDGRMIRRAAEAWFKCKSCDHRIDDVERQRLVRAGEWRATQPFYGTAGFWGWQAMSPFSTALDIANEWLGALGSKAALQSAKNETLGLPWKEKGEAPDWKRLFDRAENYALGTVPDGALFLTAGADVQLDRIEVQVIGWGRRRQAWLVDYVVLDGDTRRPEVWAKLDSLLGTVYQNAAGADFEIRKMCVDTGYEAEMAYNWARRHQYGGIVALVKGGPNTQAALVAAPSPIEIARNGKKLATGLKLHLLNVGRFKRDLYDRLSLDLPNAQKGEDYPDGFFHICHLNDTEEYCRQLTAEEYSGGKWEKHGRRNEAMDTWDYAAAGRVMLEADRFTEAHWAQLEARATRRKPEAPNVVAQQQTGGGRRLRFQMEI